MATCNDYGFEVLSSDPILDPGDNPAAQWRTLLSTENLLDDLLACVQEGPLARRQFRDIARIAGLISAGFPGQSQSNRQLQASSELFFDVFTEFDPDNLLLDKPAGRCWRASWRWSVCGAGCRRWPGRTWFWWSRSS